MSSEKGGCLCDNIRISFAGEPVKRMLCHCLDCRKISGSNYSDNAQIPNANFTLESGTPKTYTMAADSGRSITSFFCPSCGTTLYREAECLPGVKILKTGVLDDPTWQSRVPEAEVWTQRKVAWLPELGKQ